MSFMMCVVAVIWSSAILAGLMPLVGWNKYIYEVCIMAIKGGLKNKTMSWCLEKIEQMLNNTIIKYHRGVEKWSN